MLLERSVGELCLEYSHRISLSGVIFHRRGWSCPHGRQDGVPRRHKHRSTVA